MSNQQTLTQMPLEGRGFVVHDSGDYRPGEFRRLNNCELLDGRIVGRRDIRSCVSDHTDLLTSDQNYGHFIGTFNEWAISAGPKYQTAVSTSGQVQQMWNPTELSGDYSGVYYERLVGFFKYNFNNFWLIHYQRDLTSSIGLQLLYCPDLIDDQPVNYTYAGLSDNGNQVDIQLADPDFYAFRYRNFFMHKDRLWLVTNGALYFSKATDPTLFEVVDGGGFFKFPNTNINYSFALGNTIYVLADDSVYAITYTSDPNADATVRKISEVVGGMHGCVFRDTPYLINSEGVFAINNNFVTKVLDNKFDTGVNNYTRQHLTAFREYLVINKTYSQADPYHEPDGTETILRINYARNPGFKYGPKLAPTLTESYSKSIFADSYIPSGYSERGAYYDPDDGYIWKLMWHTGSKIARIYAVDASTGGTISGTGVVLGVPSATTSVNGIIKKGSLVYICYAESNSPFEASWYLKSFRTSDGVGSSSPTLIINFDNQPRPGLGYDPALNEILVCSGDWIDGIGEVQRRTLAAPFTYIGAYELNKAIMDQMVTAITYIGIGNFDHGSSRLAIADQKKLWVVNKTTAPYGAVTQEETTLYEPSFSVWHDGTNFFSSPADGWKYKYSQWHGAMDGSDRFWWVSTTNATDGTGTGETVRTARSFFAFTNRRFMYVTAGPKPSGYSHYAFYTGYGGGDPLNTAQWRQGTFQTSNAIVIGSKITSGSNPPNNPNENLERSYDLKMDFNSDVFILDGTANVYCKSPTNQNGINLYSKGIDPGFDILYSFGDIADWIALPKGTYTLSMKVKIEGAGYPANTKAILTVWGRTNAGATADFTADGLNSAEFAVNSSGYATINLTFTTVTADKIAYRVRFVDEDTDFPAGTSSFIKVKERLLEVGNGVGTYFDGDSAAGGITFYRYPDEGTLGKQMSKSEYGYFLQGLYRELSYPYFSPSLAESSGSNKLGYNTYFINMDTGAIHTIAIRNMFEGISGYLCDVFFNPSVNPLTGYPGLFFMTVNTDSDKENMYYYMNPEHSPLPFDTTFVGDSTVPVNVPPNYEIEFYSFTPDGNEYNVKKFRNLEIMGKFPFEGFELGISYDNLDFTNFRDLNDPLLESQVLRPHFPHRFGLNQRGRSISYLFRTKNPFVPLTDPFTYDKLEFSDLSLLWTPTQRSTRYSSYQSVP